MHSVPELPPLLDALRRVRLITMAHVPLGTFVGLGAAAVERWALRRGLSSRLTPLMGVAWVPALLANASAADLSEDVLGRAFVHDLVQAVPRGAVALIAGDEMVGAATYACGVLRLCEDRTIFSPGQLHMPWRVRQLRRRYPSLTLPDSPRPNATALLAANDARPEYICAALLDLDPPLRQNFEYLPDGLLLEVVDQVDRESAGARLISRAEALLTGAQCAGCDLAVARTAVTALDARVVASYAVALDNHARILELVFDAPAAAIPLRARAEALRGIAVGKAGGAP